MPVSVQEYVFWLQITVNDALNVMKVLDRQRDLGGIESRGILVESPRTSKIAEDLTSGAVVQLGRKKSDEGTSRNTTATRSSRRQGMGRSVLHKTRWLAYQHI
jgi:hypothetical protein